MADMLRFVARDDLQPLVKIAIAHAQFETIPPPFLDGDGRTGRALVRAMLNHERVMRRSVIPMSAGLLRRRYAYFSALGSFRERAIRFRSWKRLSEPRSLLSSTRIV